MDSIIFSRMGDANGCNPFITTTNVEFVNYTNMLLFFVPSDIFYCFG